MPYSAGAARQFVRAGIEGWSDRDRRDVVVLLTSELVTNAIQHGSVQGVPVRIRLLLARRDDLVRVEVWDASVLQPLLSEPVDGSGRGLRIVDRLASRWGADLEADGKTVWFEVHV